LFACSLVLLFFPNYNPTALRGLPPGHYTVSLDSKGEISTFPVVRSTTVDIADKGCARFNFHVDPFAESSGQTCIFDFERGETSNCIRQAITGELFIAPLVLRELDFDSYGLAPVLSQKDGWMYVSRSGIVVVQGVPTMDNGPDSFHDGLVRVIKDGKYGFANRAGQIVILPIYDGAGNFENGTAKVCKGCKSECVGACEYHFFAGGEWFQNRYQGDCHFSRTGRELSLNLSLRPGKPESYVLQPTCPGSPFIRLG
jgi:hypothetical protein